MSFELLPRVSQGYIGSGLDQQIACRILLCRYSYYLTLAMYLLLGRGVGTWLRNV